MEKIREAFADLASHAAVRWGLLLAAVGAAPYYLLAEACARLS